MTTTMTVRTDRDVERAVIPISSSQCPGLPISVLLFSARLAQSFRSFNRSLTLLKIIKFSVGALVGTLSLMSAWWALDLAMWSAVKDFREDCREQLQNYNIMTTACQEALSRPLREPPTWRGYLGKATDTFSWENGFLNVRWDDSVLPKRQLASRTPAFKAVPMFHDELDGCCEPPTTGIGKQGDAEIMYGGMEKALPGNLTVLFPLREARQEAFDDFWEHFHVNCPGRIWLNTTVIGTVREIQVLFVPDQRAEPLAFDEVLALMPPGLRSRRRRRCTYPFVPDSVPVNGGISVAADLLTKFDFGAALALTFVFVALGHEVIYGGFARKTRWKWQ